MQKLNSILSNFEFFSSTEQKQIISCIQNYEIKKEANGLIRILVYSFSVFNPDLDNIINRFNNTFNNFKIEIIYSNKIDLKKIIISIFEFISPDSLLISSIKTQDLTLNKGIININYYSKDELNEWLKHKNNLISKLSHHVNTNDVSINFIDGLSLNNKIEDNKKNNNSLFEQNKFKQNPSIQYQKNENVKFQKVNIIDCDVEKKYVEISGNLFYKEKISIKNGAFINKFGISDETGSIICTQYIFPNKDNLIFDQINNGDFIQIKGMTEINNFEFNDEITVKISSLFKLERKKRNDIEIKKRVDFCLHTKMSSYDGIITPDELKQLLVDLGHKRFSITDRNNVQIFPEIEKTFKGSEIKPIYGVEFEVLEKDIKFAWNIKNDNIGKFPIVIFDLETTGLFANFDDIIEFGAVKIDENHKMTKCQFFMKPKENLSEFTTNLTGITNEMVKDGLDEKTGLKKILDFISDSTLIAHNGINFDFKFLNTKLVNCGFEKLKNFMIDTLVVSRFINSSMFSHSLDKLAKKYKLEYDPNAAHRADYDAELLFRVWENMTAQLKELDINNYYELNNNIKNSESIYKTSRGSIVNIYARNQKGLRDLYELVSIANTKNYFSKPILFWEDINKLRKNLLIANNPIESSMINDLFTDIDEEINENILNFDFILIPTISSFNHEIQSGNLRKKDIINSLNKLIDKVYSLNKKPICSPGSYYLNIDDEKYYDMFITNPILNKRSHRYSKFKKGPLLYFRSTDELIDEFMEINEKLAYEIVVNNSNYISSLIDEDIQIIKKGLYPPFVENVTEKMKELVFLNAHLTYGDQLPLQVKERIEKELNSIISNNYEVVYWVSSLLVKQSIKDGFVVGSRGSVGSSIVATFLNITDVNPLSPHYLCKKCKYSEFINDNSVDDGYDLEPKFCPICNEKIYGEGHNIPFETFLGFKGDKVPDIDLNFSGIYQNKAHDFIKKMFGEEFAFRAGTISTIAEKSSFANAREYFNNKNIKANNAMIIEYSRKCLDVKRTTGQHPGGIVIVPNNMSIYDFTPINYPADDVSQEWKTTHFAFEYIHDNLLKFDILGHDNPTILKILKDLTGIDESFVPCNDEKTLKLFTDIKILGINPEDIYNEKTGAISLPEFGTKFVREMLYSANPKSFADLVRISGLSHGTDVWIGNAQSLIKEGKNIKEVIGCRDDIMNYLIFKGIEPLLSFQIMEDVRKGKGIKSEYKTILLENKIPTWYIESANKIKYMFPKAHATAYVLHAWKFAWFKLYYPLEYYAAYLTVRAKFFDVESSIGEIDKLKFRMDEIRKKLNSKKLANSVTVKEKELYGIYEVVLEAKLRGIKFENINIMESDSHKFLINKNNNSILCPFIILDNMGDVAANSIIKAREEKPFTSRKDLIDRTKITKQILKHFDELGIINELDENDQITLLNFFGN